MLRRLCFHFAALATLALATCAPGAAFAQDVSYPPGVGVTPYTPGVPAYASGFWYPQMPGSTSAGGSGGAASNVYLQPFIAAQSLTIDQIGVLVSTASGAGGAAAIYVYGANTAGNRPSGTPLGTCQPTVTATGFQACTFSSAVALTGNKV